MATRSVLMPFAQKYFESDPIGASHMLETMDENSAAEVLKSLSVTLAADVVRNTNDAFAAAVLQRTPEALFKTIVEKLDARQGGAIFLHLPPEARQQFLSYLEEKKKKEIQEFLTYPEASAGRIMSTGFLVFHNDLKARDAIQRIRQLAQKGAAASYAYVVDHENRLVGVINMRDLIVATPDASLETVMRKNVFSVDCFMDREKVAAELSARRFFAAPVVDHENHLLGVVRADQLISDVQEEATEDLQKMFGAGGDERAFSPISFSLKKRLIWLYVNLATAFLAASVVAVFEDLIARLTVLAIYLPVVAGQGGNAGAQSLAVVIRGLAMREIPPSRAKDLILKEVAIGVVNGVLIGIVTALVAWYWQGNPYLGLVIGLAMLTNLIVAGFSGAAIPIAMKQIGLDPAQCSSIILTTVTDVIGFFSFLSFAVMFQKFLM